MKRRLSLVLALILCCLLCGCFSGTEKTFTREGLSLTLPAYFVDKSADGYAKDLDFLYSYGGMGFLGIREKRSDFPAGYENMGLEAYGKFVILGNELSCELTKKDGFYTFTYEKNTPDGALTYVAVVLEEQEAYWTIQAYCLTSFYEENAELMWKYLTTAKTS